MDHKFHGLYEEYYTGDKAKDHCLEGAESLDETVIGSICSGVKEDNVQYWRLPHRTKVSKYYNHGVEVPLNEVQTLIQGSLNLPQQVPEVTNLIDGFLL